jgi:hypothetical protein
MCASYSVLNDIETESVKLYTECGSPLAQATASYSSLSAPLQRARRTFAQPILFRTPVRVRAFVLSLRPAASCECDRLLCMNVCRWLGAAPPWSARPSRRQICAACVERGGRSARGVRGEECEGRVRVPRPPVYCAVRVDSPLPVARGHRSVRMSLSWWVRSAALRSAAEFVSRRCARPLRMQLRVATRGDQGLSARLPTLAPSGATAMRA